MPQTLELPTSQSFVAAFAPARVLRHVALLERFCSSSLKGFEFKLWGSWGFGAFRKTVLGFRALVSLGIEVFLGVAASCPDSFVEGTI